MMLGAARAWTDAASYSKTFRNSLMQAIDGWISSSDKGNTLVTCCIPWEAGPDGARVRTGTSLESPIEAILESGTNVHVSGDDIVLDVKTSKKIVRLQVHNSTGLSGWVTQYFIRPIGGVDKRVIGSRGAEMRRSPATHENGAQANPVVRTLEAGTVVFVRKSEIHGGMVRLGVTVAATAGPASPGAALTRTQSASALIASSPVPSGGLNSGGLNTSNRILGGTILYVDGALKQGAIANKEAGLSSAQIAVLSAGSRVTALGQEKIVTDCEVNRDDDDDDDDDDNTNDRSGTVPKVRRQLVSFAGGSGWMSLGDLSKVSSSDGHNSPGPHKSLNKSSRSRSAPYNTSRSAFMAQGRGSGALDTLSRIPSARAQSIVSIGVQIADRVERGSAYSQFMHRYPSKGASKGAMAAASLEASERTLPTPTPSSAVVNTTQDVEPYEIKTSPPNAALKFQVYGSVWGAMGVPVGACSDRPFNKYRHLPCRQRYFVDSAEFVWRLLHDSFNVTVTANPAPTTSGPASISLPSKAGAGGGGGVAAAAVHPSFVGFVDGLDEHLSKFPRAHFFYELFSKLHGSHPSCTRCALEGLAEACSCVSEVKWIGIESATAILPGDIAARYIFETALVYSVWVCTTVPYGKNVDAIESTGTQEFGGGGVRQSKFKVSSMERSKNSYIGRIC